MKKSRIILSVFLTIAMLFVLCMPSFATEIKETWSSKDALTSFENFNNAIQSSKKLDLSKIELYPGGMPFGVKILSKGLMVVGFSETKGDGASPAYKAGVRIGDNIINLNDKEVVSIEDFAKNIMASGGKEVKLTVERDSNEMNFTFCPVLCDGEYKSGIWVKDSTSGIGTVTFINPDTNAFGGLGHAICEGTSGKIIPLARGIVMGVNITGVVKGQVGTAGELKGNFTADKIGTLCTNCANGVFGVISPNKLTPIENKMKVCPKEELKEGEAYIWSTLDEEGPKKYKVIISDIDVSNSSVKNFKIKVADNSLLEKSGGIVQGMSGSPIIQNGRIVGAVTHVLINDPSCGYGIFIENMLNSMPEILN